MKIGVLALQGDFSKHFQIIEQINAEPVSIRYPKDLGSVKGLVIPGGESTTMTKLMHRMGFHKALLKFAERYPILGTCAGLIMMSQEVTDSKIDPLGILNIKIERNGYGRQVHSNSHNIKFKLKGENYSVPATFIRAPRIISTDETVSIIARDNNTPVVVKNGKHWGISFHPELDDISIFHKQAFLKDNSGK